MQTMSDEKALDRIYACAYGLVRKNDELFFRVNVEHLGFTLYPKDVAVRAMQDTVYARRLRGFQQPTIDFGDFLLLAERYPVEAAAELMHNGYTAIELVTAFDNGIDLALMDSLIKADR